MSGKPTQESSRPGAASGELRFRLAVVAVGVLACVAVLVREFAFREPVRPPEPEARGLEPLAPGSLRPGGLHEESLPPALASALGFVEPMHWQARLSLLRDFRGHVDPGSADFLVSALMSPPAAYGTPGEHGTYFHEIASILQRHPEHYGLFARALAAVAGDAGRGGTVRDYAIQHLRQLWDRVPDGDDMRDLVRVSLAGIASGGEPKLRASALLSLHLLGTAPDGSPSRGPASRFAGAIPDSDLEPLVAEVLSQPAGGEITAHLAACRVAAERRLGGQRSALRAIFSNRGAHAMTRMAAANALGRIAHPEDLDFLSSYDPGEARVAEAARRAARPSGPVPTS